MATIAEAVEIVFDPAKISFRTLLEFFFQIHDPSTANRQGNDRGASYRSAIYYTSEEQKRVAEDTIADVNASGIWPGKVVTEVAPAGPFWQAEPEHQDYLQRIPYGYTCHWVRPEWNFAQTGRCDRWCARVASGWSNDAMRISLPSASSASSDGQVALATEIAFEICPAYAVESADSNLRR